MNIQRSGCDVLLGQERKYICLLNVDIHTKILSTSSKTTLYQTFENPSSTRPLEELRYVFPLFEGVSVVGFTACAGSKVVKGVVKEKAKAKEVYDEAKDRGEVAGLLEQSRSAGDVFVTTIGNVPAGEIITVEIEYLADLKHDAQNDTIRLTIPTSVAPRYDDLSQSDFLLSDNASASNAKKSFTVSIDAEMPSGSVIESVQSPSHPISVQIGKISTSEAKAEPSLSKASATLSLGTSELAADFVVQIGATKIGEPSAMLEKHPDFRTQRALMTTLVPKFNLPAENPEIVFICDRSGSMDYLGKIPKLKEALRVFLKSLPVGVKFNLVSFGSRYEFLWEHSQTYDQDTLDKAVGYVDSMEANFGGTEMYKPLDEVFKKRYTDMNLEVFLLTDGQIWRQDALFELIHKQTEESKGAVRLFSVGLGQDASSSLIEGIARAGNGFSQSVGDDEQATTKIIRMLKASLYPHIHDYSLELKYRSTADSYTANEGFELIEKIDANPEPQAVGHQGKEPTPISLYDPAAFHESAQGDSAAPDNKYSHLPTVATPSYVQSPHRVPALFPFNRTTVYVMLSETNSDRLPHSLLLKGTSAHGPVELEIPITHLADEGKAIHQLAARNAVKELEEGRGWMAYASDPASGELFKEKFPGRFSDMVEHEAVKLGVKYQITGKWTSFVAVEEGPAAELSQTIEEVNQGIAIIGSLTRTAQTQAMAKSQTGCAHRGRRGGFACKVAAKKKKKDLASSNGSTDIRAADTRSGERSPPREGTRRLRFSVPRMGSLGQSVPEDDSSDEDCGFGLFDDEGSINTTAPAPSLSPLQRLINLQRFNGGWSWTTELRNVLGLEEQLVSKAVTEAGAQAQSADVLATVAVILYMQLKVPEQKDTWNMIVEKAEAWTRDRQGVDGYRALGNAIRGLY